MIVIVMVMQHRCGLFRLIQQSMMDEQLSMMNHAHQHWLQPSVMEEVMTHTQVFMGTSKISRNLPIAPSFNKISVSVS